MEHSAQVVQSLLCGCVITVDVLVVGGLCVLVGRPSQPRLLSILLEVVHDVNDLLI